MKFAASARLSKNVEQAKPIDPEIARVLGTDPRSAADAQLGTPEEETIARETAARAAMRASERIGVKR